MINEIDLTDNLISSLPYHLNETLHLKKLIIPQNIIISPYSYPNFIMKENGIDIITKNDSKSKLEPKQTTLFSRVFFIGEKGSGNISFIF